MDIKVLHAKEKLPINGIDLVSTKPSVILRLVGSGYLEAETVFMNGRRMEDFAVLSDTVMTLGVPDDQLGRPVREISIYSDRRLNEVKVALDFEYMAGQRVLSSEQVVQEFVYILFGEPNTDIYHRDSAGGLIGLLPSTLGYDDGPTVRHAASIAISNTVKALKSRYRQLPRRPLNERLSDAELVSAEFNVSTGRVSLYINLNLLDGTTLYVRARS
jgi:hypothetical protein